LIESSGRIPESSPATRRYQTKLVLAISLTAAIAQASPKATLQPHLPSFFEPNRGQAPPQVRFLARGNGMSLLLEDRAAVLRLPSSELRMRFTGNPRPPQTIEPLDPLPGLSSYLLGNDSAAWRTGIPQSGRVRYQKVYPGIDLIFTAGANNRFEYDFVVAPQADPSRIAVRFDGAQSIESDGDGGIVLHTSAGEVRQPRPRIYQDFDSGRKEIRGGMILAKGNTIRFKLGEYDHTRTLTIDPLIIQYLVGNVDDEFTSIARDTAGNVYVAGYTSSTSFTSTPIGPAAMGKTHVLVAKLSPDLSIEYVAIIGGSAGDTTGGLAVDSAGNAYVIGSTVSSDFPTTAHAAQVTYGNKTYQYAQDAFILKLDPKGATLLYSSFLGGDSADAGSVITVDSNGVVYAAGYTESGNFPITPGGLHLGLVFVGNILYQATWVAKLSADGGTFDYVAVVGGNTSVSGPSGIAIDTNGNAYIAGEVYAATASGVDFPTAGHPVQPNAPCPSTNCTNGYIAEVNNLGNALVFSTYWGGSSGTLLNGLALDSEGNIYIAGAATSSDLPVTKNTIVPPPTSEPSHGAAYVAALNNSGSAVLACSYLGPEGTTANGVLVRAPGVIGVVGGSLTTSFATVQAQAGLPALGGVYVELDPLFQHLIRSFSPAPLAPAYTAAAAAPDGSVAVGGSTDLLPASNGQLVKASRNGMVVLVEPAPANAQGPVISSGGVVSASAFGAFTSVSPGSWIEIYGSNLAADTRSWAASDFNGLNAPISLDGTTVTIGGESAFIDYISPTQVNALVASNTPLGSQQITILTAQGASSAYNVTVNAAEPGLLAPPSFKIGSVQYAVAVFSDGAYALPTGAIAGVDSRPAKPGDVLVLYGVGFGPVTPSSPAGELVQQLNSLAGPFQMAVGGIRASLSYDGLAPSYTGLYQFNLTVPSVAPNNAAPLTFNLNGAAGTQSVAIAVGN
jgi:uncharacterized protein (TIGR03437 family)